MVLRMCSKAHYALNGKEEELSKTQNEAHYAKN